MVSKFLLYVFGLSLCLVYVSPQQASDSDAVTIQALVPGDDRTFPRNDWTVIVDYTGKLVDGTVFDSSIGRKPFSFIVGRGEVIPGWDEGIKSMSRGEVARMTIPPHAAYGEDGIPGVIPTNATLIFEITLLEVIPFHHRIQYILKKPSSTLN